MLKFVKYSEEGGVENVSLFSIINSWLLSTLLQLLTLLAVSGSVYYSLLILPLGISLSYIHVVVAAAVCMILTRFIYYLGSASSLLFSFPYFLILLAYYLLVR